MPGSRLIGAALIGAAAVAVVVAAPGAGAASTDPPVAQAAAARSTITMSGSTSVQPLARLLGRAYTKAFPRGPRIKDPAGGTTDVGINEVARGKVSIGNASRDPRTGDPSGLAFNRIARDGVCVVTNRANPLPDLSQAQVQAIFSGRVQDWSKVPGSKVTGSIAVKVRTPTSGTADSFKNVFMGQTLNVTTAADEFGSNGLLQQEIARAANTTAIGYVDLRFTGGTHVVNYRGTACNLANAKAGTYRGMRNFWMVTNPKRQTPAAKTAINGFLKWIRTSPQAKSIISREWVPVR